jgi:hypothetical protein
MQYIDLVRFIQVFIVQFGICGVGFLILSALILRRSTKYLNQIFSMFFINVAVGSIINVIYVYLTNAAIVRVLNIMSYYFFTWAMIFLLVFNLIIFKSQKQITRDKQLLLILLGALLLLGLFVIGLLGTVQIDETTNWKPVWELPFFLYAIITGSVLMVIPAVYFSFKIYSQFEDRTLKKKWKYYIVGCLNYYSMWVGVSLSNFLNNGTFRTILSIYALISFITLYIMYYGVGKSLN